VRSVVAWFGHTKGDPGHDFLSSGLRADEPHPVVGVGQRDAALPDATPLIWSVSPPRGRARHVATMPWPTASVFAHPGVDQRTDQRQHVRVRFRSACRPFLVLGSGQFFVGVDISVFTFALS